MEKDPLRLRAENHRGWKQEWDLGDITHHGIDIGKSVGSLSASVDQIT